MKKHAIALLVSSLFLTGATFASSIHSTVFKTNVKTPITVTEGFSAGTLSANGMCLFTVKNQPLGTAQISNSTIMLLTSQEANTTSPGPGYNCMQMQFTYNGNTKTEIFKLFSANHSYVSSWPTTATIVFGS